MMNWLKRLDTLPKQAVILVCIVFVIVVGLVDYATGYETFFFTFYLLAIFLATWQVSALFGALISALSVTAWVSANAEAGAHYSSYFIPVWNAAIMFAIYLIIVFLLAGLKNIHQELEQRVRLRTAALTREIQERRKLQKDLLETVDREQRRIGRDLHDGLCQHLTGTALAGHLLEQKLSAKVPDEAGGAARLVELVEQAIEMTRDLSHQLDPVELKDGELNDHLEDLAATTGQRLKLECNFENELEYSPGDAAVATHLYRIAQDAVAGAAMHSGVKQINIKLDSEGDDIVLTITDDGTFVPKELEEDSKTRLRAIAYRTDLIGATVRIDFLARRGKKVICALPFIRKQDD
jgi:signal transduction histidine kinase